MIVLSMCYGVQAYMCMCARTQVRACVRVYLFFVN